MKTDCYIAMGSNLGEPVLQLQNAVQTFANTPGIVVQRVSSFYQTKPYGPVSQPDFTNAVLAIATVLSPLTLLTILQQIEAAAGRERAIHWGPRTLDLDLLLYGQARIDLPTLQVPHPGLLVRDFVLQPLSEIAPTMLLPNGRLVQEQLELLAYDKTNDFS